MITVLFIIQNAKESLFLRQLFTKLKIRIVMSTPSYGSYLKALQYDPDIIIMEVPPEPKAHLQFLRAIKNNKNIGQKPFILYGPAFSDSVTALITSNGADAYLPRPLNPKTLFDEIRRLVKSSSLKKNPAEKNQLSKEEIGKLFNPNVIKQEKLEIMRKHIGGLLAFPATIASMLKITQDDKSGATELANVVKSDPAVSAEILRLANSVQFARSAGKKIIDIKDAIVRIGFTETKNIATSLSVFKVLSHRNYATGFDHNQFWFHCLGTAILSEQVARNSQLVPQEEAFMAGLLHDLGVLLLNEYFNELFLQLLEQTTSEGVRFTHYQETVMGFNHNELVAMLFREWKFPEEFCQDFLYIGIPQTVSKEFISLRPLPAIVNFSETIVKSLQIGRDVDCCVDSITNETFEAFRYPYGFLQSTYDKLYEGLNMFNQLLKVNRGTYPMKIDSIKGADKVKLTCYSFSKECFSPIIEYLKTQGYDIAIVKESSELISNEISNHAFVLTDAQGAMTGTIEKIANSSVLAYNPSADGNAEPQAAQSKVMLFDGRGELTDFKNKNVVISRYPVDLRNIDIVLACLLLEKQDGVGLNVYGAFKPGRKLSLDGQVQDMQHVLVAESRLEVQKKLKMLLADGDHIAIETAGDGQKALNYAKTSEHELSFVIINLNIPVLQCVEVVRSIKALPNHRRVKFLILLDTAQKERLIPLIQLGVRGFVREIAPAEEIKSKLVEIGMQFESELPTAEAVESSVETEKQQ